MRDNWNDILSESDALILEIEKLQSPRGWSGEVWVLHLVHDYEGNPKIAIMGTRNSMESDPLMGLGVDENLSCNTPRDHLFNDEDIEPEEAVELARERLREYYHE